MNNQVQLITYPDSLGGGLQSLRALLAGPLAGLFGGVHILPPFPSSGDRGFSPTTYFEIDPAFGTFEDVRQIGEKTEVMLDLMVNHISRRSVYFQDFEQNGRESKYADLFITLDKIWPGGDPPAADVAEIFLRRPLHPFADVTAAKTGEKFTVWATFGQRDWAEQIDVDVHSPVARELFRDILRHFSQNGVKGVRLDAVAFVIKKPGTTCFFVEPEMFEFMDWMMAEAARYGLELLPEVHAEFPLQQKLADHGYWVYNFALPFLTLQALFTGGGAALAEHLRVCPRKQFTNLDTHDGIPVQPDINGLVEIDEAQRVVDMCVARGANISAIFSPQHRLREDYDAHQINCTYYSALGESDAAYLTARAIQLFAPGIPQIYYVGLLAGENRPEEVESTGEKRAINRHNFSTEEVTRALEKPVVRRLVDLIRFRNEHPAFNGTFTIHDTPASELDLEWRGGSQWCRLRADLSDCQSRIDYSGPDGETHTFELTNITGEPQ